MSIAASLCVPHKTGRAELTLAGAAPDTLGPLLAIVMVRLHPPGGHVLRGHGGLVPGHLVVLSVYLGLPEVRAIEPVVLDRVRGCVDGGPVADDGVYESFRKAKQTIYYL